MKIIISPAKKMQVCSDDFECISQPIFLEKTQEILEKLQKKSIDELKKIWKCNDKIALENFDRIQKMSFENSKTPAILSYDGIQYKYMAPTVFEQKMFDYISNNLRILSGFYGILKPFDAVTPYRLEMQSKIESMDLYSFWSDDLYKNLDDNIIINLASKVYSKCIEKFIKPTDIFITCVFGEKIDDKIVQKATLAKMARGEMVRFMAENNISNIDDIKKFNSNGFKFSNDFSTASEYIFIK